jgi:hypothetical protein
MAPSIGIHVYSVLVFLSVVFLSVVWPTRTRGFVIASRSLQGRAGYQVLHRPIVVDPLHRRPEAVLYESEHSDVAAGSVSLRICFYTFSPTWTG